MSTTTSAAQRGIQAANIRQLNGTGLALEVFNAIMAAPMAKRGRKSKRKARAATITPEQIAKAIANRKAGLTWAAIAGYLKVSASGIKNAVSKTS